MSAREIPTCFSMTDRSVLKSESNQCYSRLPRRSGRRLKCCPKYREVSDSEDSGNTKPPVSTAKKAHSSTMDSKTFNNDIREISRDFEVSRPDSKTRQQATKTYCHSCRSKSTDQMHLIGCSRCVLAFCNKCLATRHGEDSLEEAEPGLQWVCPKCRGGCGPGCEKFCCICTDCRKVKRNIPSTGVAANVLKYTGFTNLHDYYIHLETGESKEQIANRKNSRGWTKAGGSIKNFKYIDAEYQLSPTERKAAKNKRRNVGDRSDCDSTCHPDELGGHHNHKKKHVTFDTAYTADKMETNQDTVLRQDVLCYSVIDKFQVDTKAWKGLKDVLMSFDDMTVNIYLMGLWFSKDKDLTRKRALSISLNEKQAKFRKSIQVKSHAKAIACQFFPADGFHKFCDRPKYQQEEMKDHLNELILRRELEASRIHLHNVCKEIIPVVIDHLSRVKINILSAIDSIMKAVTNVAARVHGNIMEKIIDSNLLMGDGDPLEQDSQNVTRKAHCIGDFLKDIDTKWDDRTAIKIFDTVGTIRNALGAELDRLGVLAVSVHLASEWFIRKKGWERNRLVINLNENEIKMKKKLKKDIVDILLPVLMRESRRDEDEHFQATDLSHYSDKIEDVLQKNATMIVTALTKVESNGNLALENITYAVQEAVDSIS